MYELIVSDYMRKKNKPSVQSESFDTIRQLLEMCLDYGLLSTLLSNTKRVNLLIESIVLYYQQTVSEKRQFPIILQRSLEILDRLFAFS